MESWYLVMCKPRQEERAKANLNNQGIEAFYPILTTEKLVKGRRTVKQVALFPNYLFVYLDSKSGPFSAVKNTRGIGGFVTYGANYQVVPLAIIEYLNNHKSHTVESQLPKQGDAVSVNNNSFKNKSNFLKFFFISKFFKKTFLDLFPKLFLKVIILRFLKFESGSKFIDRKLSLVIDLPNSEDKNSVLRKIKRITGTNKENKNKYHLEIFSNRKI